MVPGTAVVLVAAALVAAVARVWLAATAPAVLAVTLAVAADTATVFVVAVGEGGGQIGQERVRFQVAVGDPGGGRSFGIHLR